MSEKIKFSKQGHYQPTILIHPNEMNAMIYRFQDKKNSQKNKFINKLKQLQWQGASDGHTIPNNGPSIYYQNSKKTGRRERNKVAARDSRNRKRLYVQLLQGKIGSIQQELKTIENQIEQTRLEIFNVQMHQNGKVLYFSIQHKQVKNKQIHIIKKIQNLLACQCFQQKNNQINICLDSIIYRIGAQGSQRRAVLQKLYIDLLSFSQPALHRYMLWTAQTKKHLFKLQDNMNENQQNQYWCKQFKFIAQQALTFAKNKGANFKQIGQQLASKAHIFKKYGKDLTKFRSQIQKKGKILDNVVSQVREIFSPEQVALMMLFVQKHQFKKEIRLFEDEEGMNCQPEKKVKIQQ